jgi:glycosyltransferase involved in cell wall biosynthesis
MNPSSTPPISRRKVIEKEPGELVMLVSGAFLPWYDYKTLFKALNHLIKCGKTNFKVVFLGGNPRNPKFEKLILSMGQNLQFQKRVIFSGLFPFKERGDYYLQSDVGFNIPLPTVEDELSVRTRIVDYIWGGLPVITPARDEYSKMVVENGGGFTYIPNDSLSLSRLLENMMSEEGQETIKKARESMKDIYQKILNTKEVMEPLEEFIREPFIDPERKSPKRFLPEFLLLARDLARDSLNLRLRK